MAAPSIFTEKELAFLRELVRQGVAFMVVGLSAAALQGAPAVTQDIDLWFKDLADPKLKKALERVGGLYIPPTGTTPPMLAGRSVALFDIVITGNGSPPLLPRDECLEHHCQPGFIVQAFLNGSYDFEIARCPIYTHNDLNHNGSINAGTARNFRIL